MSTAIFKFHVSYPLFCNGESCWVLVGTNGQTDWMLMKSSEIDSIIKSDNWAFTDQTPPSLQVTAESR